MKPRNFFPRQALRRLAGRDPASLSLGERSALDYFLRNSRKLQQPLLIVRPLAAVMSNTPDWAGVPQCAVWRTGRRSIALDFEQLAVPDSGRAAEKRGAML